MEMAVIINVIKGRKENSQTERKREREISDNNSSQRDYEKNNDDLFLNAYFAMRNNSFAAPFSYLPRERENFTCPNSKLHVRIDKEPDRPTRAYTRSRLSSC